MTESEKKQFRYLNRDVVERIHAAFFELSIVQGEPVESWEINLIKSGELESSLVQIQTKFFGRLQYPTIEAKAANLFYQCVKGHYFYNGNKRMAVLVLSYFLLSNGFDLTEGDDTKYMKTIEIAESNALESIAVIESLTEWFRATIRPIKDSL